MRLPMDMDDIGKLVNELRCNGFDASKGLLNGYLGLLVGPKGLDTKRLPRDTKTIFFPLWEINDPANKQLVQSRDFHTLYESRPPNWRVSLLLSA
jgi:hypothetical protein